MAGYNSMNGGYNPSEGMKRSTIPYSSIPNHSSESYVATSAQRVVEHVTYIAQTKVEPTKDYGVTTGRPLGLLHDPQDEVTEFRYRFPPEVEPVKNYGVTSDKWGRPSALYRQPVVVTDYGYGAPTKVEPVKDYGVPKEVPKQHYGYGAPTKVEPVKDNGVTNEVPRQHYGYGEVPRQHYGYGAPTKVEPVKDYGVTNEVPRQHYGYGAPTKVEPVKDNGVTTEVPRQHYGYGAPTKVEPVKDNGVTNEVPRPSSLVLNCPPEVDSRPRRPGPLSATNWRNIPNSASQGGNTGYGEYINDDSDDWNKPRGNSIREEYNRPDYDSKKAGSKGPTLANKEGMERPSHKFGTAPPSRHSTPLSGPTNDIGKAMEIPKVAAKSSPAPTVIDSSEAARTYGGVNLSSRPFRTRET